MMSSKNPWSVQAIVDRIEHEKQQAADAESASDECTTVGYSVRGLWSCYADPGKLTAAQAHTAMQLHLECGVKSCHVRARARNALVAAGRMVLDLRAARASTVTHRSLLTLLRVAVIGCTALFAGGRHALR